jgi:hypothetical protein
MSWTGVLIGVLAYVGCNVRLEVLIPTKAGPFSRYKLGARSPSLIHPSQRIEYDQAALRVGLWGVANYALWTLGCVLAALLKFPINLSRLPVTFIVLIPLIIGWAVVTVLGQLSFGCLVMYISVWAVTGFNDLGLAGVTPWWAVWS